MATNVHPPRIVAHPGFPGNSADGLDDAYPDTIDDVRKLLAEYGVTLAFESTERKQIALKSADWWLPVLVVVQNVGADVAATAIVDTVKYLFSARPRSRASLKLGYQKSADETIVWLEMTAGED